MPEIRLRINEADGDLPAVCMCCGEPAENTKAKRMQWCPPWVGVLILGGLIPYLIVAMIMTKRATVQAPFCDQHQGHWFNRMLLMWGTFVLFGMIGGAALVFGLTLQKQDQDTVMPFVCAGSGVLFVIWLIIVIVCQNTVIRPKEITESDITLTGVSEAFITAVEDDRDARRERKRKRRRQREEEEDEEEEEPRPRKKPPKLPPSDAFEE